MKPIQLLLLLAYVTATSACGNEPVTPPVAVVDISADKACDAAWEALVRRFESGAIQSDSMIREWEKSKSSCAGSDVFEIRLAGLYYGKGEFGRAKALLSGAVPVSETYRDVRDTFLLRIGFQESMQRKDSKAQTMTLLEDDFVRLYARSTSCAAFAAMSEYSMYVGKLPRAVEAADKAVRCEPSSSAWQRRAALANEWAGQHQQATKYCSDAFDLNRNLKYDEVFMLSCANSYARIQNFEVANSILTIMKAVLPNASSSPEFKRVQSVIESAAQKD